MKIIIFCFILLFFAIVYLLHKIERQKIKIIYLSRQNHLLTNDLNSRKLIKNSIDNISNTEIKFLKMDTCTALLKNTTFIRIAPFDFAPKIIDIKKNTEIKILSKIIISNEYWYEIIINNADLSYNLKGWVKEYGIEFIYPQNKNLIEIN